MFPLFPKLGNEPLKLFLSKNKYRNSELALKSGKDPFTLPYERIQK